MCAWRQLSLEYAQMIRPDAATLTADALEIDKYCSKDEYTPVKNVPLPPLQPVASDAACTFYADATKGNDANPGTEAKPVRSPAAGVALAREAKGNGAGPCAVLLRAGTFYIGDEGPIALGPDDSGLTLAAYPGEEGSVWLSGGKPLPGLKWEAHAVHPARNGTLAPETGVNNQHGPSP